MEMQKTQLAFMLANMMEMEIELRAHSILLDALVQQVITVEEIPENLQLARRAPSMLAYVGEKYRLLGKLPSHGSEDNERAVARLVLPMQSRDYTN
ncbi:MAG: hypothetical protein ACRYFU_17795 [Janthinobacterium lividum]